MNKIPLYIILLLFFSCQKNLDWAVYSGSTERTQYIDSDIINKNNISRLEKIWEYSCLLYTSDAADED